MPKIGTPGAQDFTQKIIEMAADQMLNVNAGDPVTASAPLAVDSNDPSAMCRVMGSLTPSAFKWTGRLPAGSSKVDIHLHYHVETVPGVAKVVRFDTQGEGYPDDAAKTGFSAAQGTDIAIATTPSRRVYVVITLTLAALGLSPGDDATLVFSRATGHVNDTLVDGFHPNNCSLWAY